MIRRTTVRYRAWWVRLLDKVFSQRKVAELGEGRKAGILVILDLKVGD